MQVAAIADAMRRSGDITALSERLSAMESAVLAWKIKLLGCGLTEEDLAVLAGEK